MNEGVLGKEGLERFNKWRKSEKAIIKK